MRPPDTRRRRQPGRAGGKLVGAKSGRAGGARERLIAKTNDSRRRHWPAGRLRPSDWIMATRVPLAQRPSSLCARQSQVPTCNSHVGLPGARSRDRVRARARLAHLVRAFPRTPPRSAMINRPGAASEPPVARRAPAKCRRRRACLRIFNLPHGLGRRGCAPLASGRPSPATREPQGFAICSRRAAPRRAAPHVDRKGAKRGAPLCGHSNDR